MDVTVAASPDPSLRDAVDLARDLGVDPATGLTAAEAARRLAAEGPNELRAKPPVPLWRKIIAQFRDPLIYLLLVAVVISVAAWVAEGAAGVPTDSLVIAAVIVLNGVIGFAQQNRAEHAVAALQSMTAATATVLRDGELRTVPASELVRGDILALSEGDAVGADARLLTASALRVAEASLTGESVPVTKTAAALPEAVPLADRRDMVFKGTAVAEGVGRAAVTGTGMGTEMGAIAELLEATREEVSPLQKEIAGVSKFLGIAVIGIAVVVMVVTALVNEVATVSEFVTVLLLGVSLAVAAVPEGLPAILSVVLALGVQRMARRNAVVKKLRSVETLGSASVDVMARPPRDIGERIIDRRMWTGILSIGLVMGIATLLTMDIFLPGGFVEGSDSLEVARTAAFTTLVFAQLFNTFNSRSETTSAFRHLFTNHWLWIALAVAASLQVAVVEAPFLQAAFGTAPLDLVHWAVAIATASAVLWFDELRKLVHRVADRA